MKIAIIGMQKNERELLPTWVEYYGAIFGYENLYILDNKSTCKDTLLVTERIKSSGIKVIHKDSRSDFEIKGILCYEVAKSCFDNGYDFAYFADIDEFLVINNSDNPELSGPDSLLGEFDSLSNINTSLFRISVGWLNIPNTTKVVIDKFGTQKIILRRDAPRNMVIDIGFHLYDWGRRRDLNEYGNFHHTRFGLLHYHNKPYFRYVESAKDKLKDRVASFEPADLAKYQGSGIHLIKKLLQTEAEYYSGFKEMETRGVDISIIFNSLGLQVPFQ